MGVAQRADHADPQRGLFTAQLERMLMHLVGVRVRG